jgi:hypothetical protein
MNPDSAIIRSLSDQFYLSIPGTQDFREQLVYAINNLIQNDFPRLVQILYRMDISEARLKDMVVAHEGHDAGLIIADLLIERERQKIESRKTFKQRGHIPEDEKW